MGSVGIFSLDFSGIKFAVSRDLVCGFRLQAGDYVMSLPTSVADALASGGRRIRSLAAVAKYHRKELRSGATFRRDLLSVDGRTVHLELGVNDTGDSIYLEVGTGRMTLTDQQAQVLLAVLDQLGRDVTAIYRASDRSPDLTIAQSMRGWLYPWEVDPEW